MNKSELVAKVAETAGIKKTEAAAAVDAFFSTVQGALVEGDKVQLIGFGTFEVKVRSAREGRNPATGEKIQIAEARVPSFKAGKALKDAMN